VSDVPKIHAVAKNALIHMYQLEISQVDADLDRMATLVIEGIYMQGWYLREVPDHEGELVGAFEDTDTAEIERVPRHAR
jgi:hypothetical protein